MRISDVHYEYYSHYSVHGPPRLCDLRRQELRSSLRHLHVRGVSSFPITRFSSPNLSTHAGSGDVFMFHLVCSHSPIFLPIHSQVTFSFGLVFFSFSSNFQISPFFSSLRGLAPVPLSSFHFLHSPLFSPRPLSLDLPSGYLSGFHKSPPCSA